MATSGVSLSDTSWIASTIQAVTQDRLSNSTFDRQIKARVHVAALCTLTAAKAIVESLMAMGKLPFAAIEILLDPRLLPYHVTFGDIATHLNQSIQCIKALFIDAGIIFYDPDTLSARYLHRGIVQSSSNFTTLKNFAWAHPIATIGGSTAVLFLAGLIASRYLNSTVPPQSSQKTESPNNNAGGDDKPSPIVDTKIEEQPSNPITEESQHNPVIDDLTEKRDTQQPVIEDLSEQGDTQHLVIDDDQGENLDQTTDSPPAPPKQQTSDIPVDAQTSTTQANVTNANFSNTNSGQIPNSGSNMTNVIAAIICGIIPGLMIFCCCNKRKKNRVNQPPEEGNPNADDKTTQKLQSSSPNTLTNTPVDDADQAPVNQANLVNEPDK